MSRVLLVAALLTGCGGGAATSTPVSTSEPTPETHTITGTLALTDSEAFARFNDDAELTIGGANCVAQTTHGFVDIESGMQITVKDESGRILGTGVTEGGPVGGLYDYQQDACVWTFTVEGLDAAEFYTIEAGRRGGPTYAFDDLAAEGWTVELTIG